MPVLSLAAGGSEREVPGSVVQPSQHLCGVPDLLVGEALPPRRNVTRDERQHIATVFVAAPVLGTAVKTLRGEMGQELCHEWRRLRCRASHRLTDPDHPSGETPTRQRPFLTLRPAVTHSVTVAAAYNCGQGQLARAGLCGMAINPPTQR